ncbi:MAG: NTP transferase domain-containing protein [Fimbriimonadaceae bacterium]
MPASATLDAILPAGGRLGAELAAKVGTDIKALIEIDGKPLLEHVFDAIQASGLVRRTVLIGGSDVRAKFANRATYAIDEADSGPANMYNGLETLLAQADPPTRILLATTDLPYVRGQHVARLIEMAPTDKQIVVPAVRRADFEVAYPGTSSTFVKLKDGEFTLGGMFLIDATAMRNMRPHAEAVFNQRKSKFGMAKLLGFGFALRFATNRLSLLDVERKIVSLLGCSAGPVPGAPAEFAYDIDDWEDYSYAVARQASP